MDQFDFRGKKVLVTGASSGVGRDTAILLSRMGAQVIIVARREERLRDTLEHMEGTGHEYCVLDLGQFDETVRMIERIVAQDKKKIDCVAHCAGVAVPVPLRAMTESAIEQTLKTNFYSFAAILKCASKKKLFSDGGAIVGVSSCVAPYGQAGNGVYGASKGAMNALMRSAAKELSSRSIRVNTICPAGIRTEMMANQSVKVDGYGDTVDTLPDTLMASGGVASIIVALLSDSMRYVSGVALDVDRARVWEV